MFEKIKMQIGENSFVYLGLIQTQEHCTLICSWRRRWKVRIYSSEKYEWLVVGCKKALNFDSKQDLRLLNILVTLATLLLQKQLTMICLSAA